MGIKLRGTKNENNRKNGIHEVDTGRKEVLIVDDEQSVRLLVKKFLSDDYTVIEASDGQKAVDVARSQKPDIILMDIMMPTMDGLTACSEIKRNASTSKIPIIMLTGVDYELNKRLCKELGASAYITKPFSLQELLDIVSKFLPQNQ
jgi:CheY-like chemotaxis protein